MHAVRMLADHQRTCETSCKKGRRTQAADGSLPHRGPPVIQQRQQGPCELSMLLGHEAPILGDDLIQNVQALICDVRRPLQHHIYVTAGPADGSLKLWLP